MTSCAVLSTSASCCVWYPGVDPKAKSSGEAVNGFRVSTSFFLSKVDLSMDLRVARPGVGRGGGDRRGENATVLPTSLRSIETRRDARRPDREARDRTADGETTGAIRGTRCQRLSRETTGQTRRETRGDRRA